MAWYRVFGPLATTHEAHRAGYKVGTYTGWGNQQTRSPSISAVLQKAVSTAAHTATASGRADSRGRETSSRSSALSSQTQSHARHGITTPHLRTTDTNGARHSDTSTQSLRRRTITCHNTSSTTARQPRQHDSTTGGTGRSCDKSKTGQNKATQQRATDRGNAAAARGVGEGHQVRANGVDDLHAQLGRRD